MSPPFEKPAAAEATTLHIQRLPGRLRRVRHLLLLMPVAVAAWAWFGVTGAVPVVVWWWHCRPVAAAGHWRLELAGARAARLGPWRTRILFRGRPAVEIFNDELSGRDLARLRRTLKAQLAGNRPGPVL